MKSKLLLTIFSAFACNFIFASDWVTVPNQVTDISKALDTVIYSRLSSPLSGNVSQLASGIKTYTGSSGYFPDSWASYFAGDMYGYDQSYYARFYGYLAVPTVKSASKTTQTQIFTSFTLSDEVLNADLAKISFSLSEISRIGFSESNSISYNTQFTFGLINLATGEACNTYINGDLLVFNGVSSSSNLWTAQTDENGLINVSFELDSDYLHSITDAGLGLIIQSIAPSDSGYFTEDFCVYDFTVEYQQLQIPEPASVGMFLGTAIFALVCVRRRNPNYR